jgi:hypothetical protein
VVGEVLLGKGEVWVLVDSTGNQRMRLLAKDDHSQSVRTTQEAVEVGDTLEAFVNDNDGSIASPVASN